MMLNKKWLTKKKKEKNINIEQKNLLFFFFLNNDYNKRSKIASALIHSALTLSIDVYTSLVHI